MYKFVRNTKYDNSQCNRRFVFFSPSYKEMKVRWYFPYKDFELRYFLKVYPELSEEDVEVISPPPSGSILVCNYLEVDALTEACSIDFDGQRFFREWKGEYNKVIWKHPNCDLVCGLDLNNNCPHPKGCPYKYPYYQTSVAVVVAPELVADVWLVPVSELDFWVSDVKSVKRWRKVMGK